MVWEVVWEVWEVWASVRPEVPGCLEDPIDSEDLDVSGRSREPGCPEVSKSDGLFSDSRASLTPQSRRRAKNGILLPKLF